MNEQKSTFLQIASVLVALCSIVGLVLNIALLCTVDGTPLFGISLGDVAFNFGIDRLGAAAAILSLLTMACGLVAGIMGLRNSRAPEKMNSCLAWAVACMIMCVFSCYIIIGVSVNEINIATYIALAVSIFLGVIIPAIYVAAASSFKKRAQSLPEKAAA